MALVLTDLGGQKILEDFFSAATMTLTLFVDPGSTSDGHEYADYEDPIGPDTYEINLGAVAYAVSLTTEGVPQIEWTEQVWNFTGPLTNSSGNRTVLGYTVAADDIVLWEEMLPEGGITPDLGNKLTIYPQFLLGNGTPA